MHIIHIHISIIYMCVLVCNAGDPGLIVGSGRSTGEGIAYLLQYSGLENSMDCIVHWACKESAQLSDSTFTLL